MRWFMDCRECASCKTVCQAPCSPLQHSVTSCLYEHIALDIMGPLPKTLFGNRYILFIGDFFFFLKWTGRSYKESTWRYSFKHLTEEWVCRHGTPRTIHTDQGRNFVSQLFKQLCWLLVIHKTRISLYSPQSDRLVKRFNGTLSSMLSLFVEENQLNWDALLPHVMMAFCSSLHSNTGFSPFWVLFVRVIVLQFDIVLNVD